MDPRNKWSGRDWAIAIVYFNMLDCKPPGEDYAVFYQYCMKHKPVTQARVLKTISQIARFKKFKITERDKCISKKIAKLWKRIYINFPG